MKKLSFEDWQKQVNIRVIKIIGLTIDDLPDFDYWSAWDAGISPSETARDVIQAARDY